jgi:small subunit ribosomal protein S9
MRGTYYQATGRRKCAMARVRLYSDDEPGHMIVNGKPAEEYFPRPGDLDWIAQPLQATGLAGKFSISIKVAGGGSSGQADAVRHGIARALVRSDAELRAALRRGGFLTRDARVKERKKPGLKRARKAPQYTKR